MENVNKKKKAKKLKKFNGFFLGADLAKRGKLEHWHFLRLKVQSKYVPDKGLIVYMSFGSRFGKSYNGWRHAVCCTLSNATNGMSLAIIVFF